MMSRALAFTLPLWLLVGACSKSASPREAMKDELQSYIDSCDADIGVAVIIEGTDTVEVNGSRHFPMLSVYKFPIALAVADRCRRDSVSLSSVVSLPYASLHRDTYSPMLADYAQTDTVRLTVRELMKYSLEKSDNNASDVLLDMAGGPRAVMDYLERNGWRDINVRSGEADMHRDTSLCRLNSATPLAMASLMCDFDNTPGDSVAEAIRNLMIGCDTGADRLAAPLAATNVVIGHKTGTGGRTPAGRLMAVNDAGFVRLPDGRRYAVAVFVADSGRDIDGTSAMVARISEIVLRNVSKIRK